MKIVFTIFALLAFVLVVVGEKPPKVEKIVQENAICLEEIKALELCLSEAGQGKGWCNIGEIVKFPLFKTSKFSQISNSNLFLDSAEAVAACMKPMEKMNECIKGKARVSKKPKTQG